MARLLLYCILAISFCHKDVIASLIEAENEVVQHFMDKIDFLHDLDKVIQKRMNMLNTRLDAHAELLEQLLHENFRGRQKRQTEMTSCEQPNYAAEELSNRTCSSNRRKYPTNCKTAAKRLHRSGIYTIQADILSKNPFIVDCDEETDGGGWTIIQRRLDGSVDFYRDWKEYRRGFGNMAGEFFIGLDKLHALTTTSDEPQELLIIMEDFDGLKLKAAYDAFAIGDESEDYALKLLGKYSGDAGDSLTPHAGLKFTTKDRDNDNDPTNCAQVFAGAWWYGHCHTSNLNGLYLSGPYSNSQFGQGVMWKTFHDYNYSLKFVQMMIRPRKEQKYI